MIAVNFSQWYEERKAAFEMEDQIMKEKLGQGIDGIEWLVLQVGVDRPKEESLEQWLSLLPVFGVSDVQQVMLDALTIEPDPFYDKYGFNWYISISETLTFLAVQRQRDYETYFQFIDRLKMIIAQRERVS